MSKTDSVKYFEANRKIIRMVVMMFVHFLMSRRYDADLLRERRITLAMKLKRAA